MRFIEGSKRCVKQDEWPDIGKSVLDANILVVGTPIWLGEVSSECRKIIERLYAHSGQTNDKGQYVFYVTCLAAEGDAPAAGYGALVTCALGTRVGATASGKDGRDEFGLLQVYVANIPRDRTRKTRHIRGVAILSSVPGSTIAVKVNIEIMRTIVRPRRLTATPGELVELTKFAMGVVAVFLYRFLLWFRVKE